MSDFKSMGLLDFQSKSTHISPLFNNLSMKRELQQPTELSNYHKDQNLATTETSNPLIRYRNIILPLLF